MNLVARIVVPLVFAFALFVAMAVAALRGPAETRREPLTDPGWPAFLRFALVTVLGGYGCFLLIVIVFHVAVANQRGALPSALRGGGFLAFGVALPVFVLLGSIPRIASRARRRDRTR